MTKNLLLKAVHHFFKNTSTMNETNCMNLILSSLKYISAVRSQQEGPGPVVAFLCGVCMFSMCLSGFLLTVQRH